MNPLYFFIVMFFLTIICYTIIFISRLYISGGVYNSIREKCINNFCNYKLLEIDINTELRQKLENIAKDSKNGIRMDVINWKGGRTIPCNELWKLLPEVKELQISLIPKISYAIGEQVYLTEDNLPTTCSMLIYEKNGDFINWHYDVNYYKGRFFTLIIPVTINETCTKFKFMQKGKSIEIGNEQSQSILFEGERLFHMATPICKGEFRVVLSFQYVTNTDIDITKMMLLKFKDSTAYVGINNKDIFNWCIRIIHMTITLSIVFYVFFYYNDTSYDYIYIILFTIMFIHWIIFNQESVLDYIEKKIIKHDYIYGSQKNEHVYLNIIHPKLVILLNVLILFNIVFVINRSILLANDNIKIIISCLIALLFIHHHFCNLGKM